MSVIQQRLYVSQDLALVGPSLPVLLVRGGGFNASMRASRIEISSSDLISITLGVRWQHFFQKQT
jgi:hypothetical protein